jgi:hypothetical protein
MAGLLATGRLNLHARTRTAHGTRRAIKCRERASHAGLPTIRSGTPGTRVFDLSRTLLDRYRFVASGRPVWSPLKDLDPGAEAIDTCLHARAQAHVTGPEATDPREIKRGIGVGMGRVLPYRYLVV